MALTPAQRQKNRRHKKADAGLVDIRLSVPYRFRIAMKRIAERNGKTLQDWLNCELEQSVARNRLK